MAEIGLSNGVPCAAVSPQCGHSSISLHDHVTGALNNLLVCLAFQTNILPLVRCRTNG